MSVYGMRHTSGLPAGFRFPASIARDSWEDRTTVLPVKVVEDAIREKSRVPFLPAWQYPDSGLTRPDAGQVLAWARAACAYRSPERKAYARAWVLFCTLGGMEAPPSRGLSPSLATAIRRRFAALELFDPRDFAAVPF